MKIEDTIEFMLNKSFDEILKLFAQSKVAIHTMKEEHFGISIVEMMSAGLITIAHDSAGPKMDIIGGAEEPVGYLANDLESYKKALV
jgi:alpha-1,2-mannosyltransferase